MQPSEFKTGVWDSQRNGGEGGQEQKPQWGLEGGRACESLWGLCFCSSEMLSRCRDWSSGVLMTFPAAPLSIDSRGMGQGGSRDAGRSCCHNPGAGWWHLGRALTSHQFQDEPRLTQRVVLMKSRPRNLVSILWASITNLSFQIFGSPLLVPTHQYS